MCSRKTRLLIIVFSVITLILSGCASSSGNTPEFSTGTPWLFSNVDGVVTPETPVDLKEDFYIYTNHKLLSEDIPDGLPYLGTFISAEKKMRKDVFKMLQSGPPSDPEARKAYDFYMLLQDWEKRNERGVEPLKTLVDKIEKIESLAQLSDFFLTVPAWERRISLWAWVVTDDGQDPEKPAVYFTDLKTLLIQETPSLILQAPELYTSAEDVKENFIWKNTVSFLSEVLSESLYYTEDQATQIIENCLSFEMELANKVIPTLGDKYLLSINPKKLSREEFEIEQGPLPILEEMHSYGYPDQDYYYMYYPDMIRNLVSIYTEENLTIIKDYMIVQAILNSVLYLDRTLFDLYFSNSNVKEHFPEYAAEIVNSCLPWQTGRLYIETYVDNNLKQQTLSLVEMIKDGYRCILEENDFLADYTKANAIEKLDNMKCLVGFPDDWTPYGSISFEVLPDLWETYSLSEKDRFDREIQLLNHPELKDAWPIPPQTPNCVNNPSANAIIISGSYMNSELFNSDMPIEEKLGLLGFVIAHEVSHSFDSQGSLFDKDGRIADWWTESDKLEFQKRIDRLASYYDNIHPFEGLDLRGETYTGEACADFAAMKCLLRIAKQIEGFDYDLFFKSYARLMFFEITKQLYQHTISDFHPPYYLRVNVTLQQYDEFLDFYGIKEGDTMYLSPSDRITVW